MSVKSTRHGGLAFEGMKMNIHWSIGDGNGLCVSASASGTRGAFAKLFLIVAGEMAVVIQTNFNPNLFDRQAGLLQELPGLAEPCGFHVLAKRDAGFLLKDTPQAAGRDVEGLGYRLHAGYLGQILFCQMA